MSDWIADLETLLTKGWREGPCWTCGRSVVTDGLSICDPDPTDAGTVVIGSRRGEPFVGHREDVVGRIPLWQAHFYTCNRKRRTPPLAGEGVLPGPALDQRRDQPSPSG